MVDNSMRPRPQPLPITRTDWAAARHLKEQLISINDLVEQAMDLLIEDEQF